MTEKINEVHEFTRTRLQIASNATKRLVVCFGFNGPLREYFSLYWAASQREGEREEKG